MKFDLHDSQLLDFLTQAQRKKMSLEEYLKSLTDQLHERIVSQDNFQVGIKDKLDLSYWVINLGLREYNRHNSAIAWTGGKDSTVLLWMIREVCNKESIPLPGIVLINEGDMFEEVSEFVQELSNEWQFEYTQVQNDDVLAQVKVVGDEIEVKKLNARNKKELTRIGYNEKTLIFEPESLEGNHLMKTVVQNQYIEKHDAEAFYTGIRWDEQEARSNEKYFSPRGDDDTPYHTRIHPLLHLSEKDIWQLIHDNSIPYCNLYSDGYRSLGAKSSTSKAGAEPAWKQDMDTTTERAGRAQDKEEIMKRLRDLGYM